MRLSITENLFSLRWVSIAPLTRPLSPRASPSLSPHIASKSQRSWGRGRHRDYACQVVDAGHSAVRSVHVLVADAGDLVPEEFYVLHVAVDLEHLSHVFGL